MKGEINTSIKREKKKEIMFMENSSSNIFNSSGTLEWSQGKTKSPPQPQNIDNGCLNSGVRYPLTEEECD